MRSREVEEKMREGWRRVEAASALGRTSQVVVVMALAPSVTGPADQVVVTKVEVVAKGVVARGEVAKARAEAERVRVRVVGARARVDHALRGARQRRSQSDCRALARLCRRGTSCKRPRW